ncbi:MAG: LuxR C-terminal-related transcriptional regulator [Rudaea sp.]|uniref:LuxR C-terminal-related transcriptional regulator n=1 Tax=Rudaea sp. TaxID=2136325 RepID=UPI0039E55257
MKDTTKTSGVRQKPLVTTKLRPPRNRGALIRRPKLIAALQQTLNRKLALVHGPAGYGKTTLAAQWFEELGASGVAASWLAIDAADNDINRFLAYLVESIHVADPELGSGLHEVIEANPRSGVDFVLDGLVNDFSVLEGNFVLFLDDWHLITNEAVHSALDLLITRSSPNVHIVVISRTRLNLPSTRLRVQGELVEIDTSLLRFDLEESKAYLTVAKGLKLRDDDLRALWQSTEGWAAALQLTSLSLLGSSLQDRIVSWTSGSATDIGEYLSENVVSKLPADQVDFMVKTSILERLSDELCEAVTGRKNSAAMLDALEHQELFLLPLDEDRQWFRYHHMFARFLQRRLRQFHGDSIHDLHVKASEWFGAHGQTLEAVEHALLADDTKRAADLVERDAMPLVEHSYMSSLLNLVGKLPRTILFDRPRLQMAIAWANCLTHRPQEASEALWHVERVAATMEELERNELLGEADVVRACTAVYADQIETVEKLVTPCLGNVADYQPWSVGVAANILAYRYIHTCQFSKVASLLQWARNYQDSAHGLFSGVYGRCFQGIAHYRSGDFDLAKHQFADALKVAEDTAGRQSNAAKLASALLGQLYYDENNLVDAERLLNESRFLGFEGGVVDFYLATYLSSCRLMLQKGRDAEALALLEEGEETAQALSLDRLTVAVVCERVRVKLLDGDIRGAEQMLGEVEARCAPPDGSPGTSDEIQAYIRFAKARLLCARGSPALAIRILREQIAICSQSGWRQQQWLAQILLAITLDQHRQAFDAEQLLLSTLTEAVPRGMVRPFLDEGYRLIAILDRVRDKARRKIEGDVGQLRFNTVAQKLLTISRHPELGIPGRERRHAHAMELTTRETEVLRLVDQGRANKEIARVMSISLDTVKWYLKNIFVKLGVSTRTQAINEARRMNLFGMPKSGTHD